VVGAGAAISPAHSESSDPFSKEKSIYFSDKVLHDAMVDISSMGTSELRSFSHYIAECSDEGITDTAQHACNAAETAYDLEFSQFVGGNPVRSLDQFIIARSALLHRPLSYKVKDADFMNPNL